MVQVPMYFCPSDRKGMWKGDQYHRHSPDSPLVGDLELIASEELMPIK